MRNSLLGAFGLAVALTLSSGAMAQMHDNHDRKDSHKPAPKPAPKIWKDNYGSWNSSWGARPGAAPSFWNKKGDWYRHVRACNIKYKSYNSRTDTYRIGGKSLRCKL